MKKEFEAIQNFLDDHYSKEDYLAVINRFGYDGGFKELKDYLESYWSGMNDDTIPDEKYQLLRLKVQQQILEQELQKRTPVYPWRFKHPLAKIAAILIVALLFTTLHFYIQWRELASIEAVYAEIYCPPGTRSLFNLPDGTTGWLNSDSHLKYPVRFLHNRHVELKGEAWFNIRKKRDDPFTVKAAGLRVEALGTQFNVMAYPDCDRVEVSLEEGSVKVTMEGTDLNERLKPDQRLVHDKLANKASLISGDTGYFTSWKDGYLVFRNVPLKEVAARLARWYNSEISIEDDVLKEVPFRATFRNESLERVLSLLAISTPISYQLIEPKTFNDEIYEKQKVKITIKN